MRGNALNDDLTSARSFVDQFQRDGSKAVTLCADVTLFLKGSPVDCRTAILDFYAQSLDQIGTSVTWVRNGDATRFKRPPKNLAALLEEWYDRGGPDKGSYCLCLESSEQPDEPSEQAFDFSWVLGQGYIRLVLPARFALESPDAFAALARHLASGVDFRFGTAGLAVNMRAQYSSTDASGALARISQRRLGIDLDQPQSWPRLTQTSIKTVNWLTFLGARSPVARAAAHVGGQEKLAAELGQNVAVTRLSHGVMIQAGAAPGFGDTTKGETLPEYRQVARALRGLKVPLEVLRHYSGIGGTENTRKWLNRFD